MERLAIPRIELENFARDGYKDPLLNVAHYPLDSNYFVIENRDSYPVKDYISPHRRKFYKIFHMTSGTGVLTIGLHRYKMGPDEIAFLHPDEVMSWQTTSTATGGHFCLIHPKYFDHADHVLQLFRQYPYFKPSEAVIQLAENQSIKIHQHFEMMFNEEKANDADKKQAIHLYLQMILLEAKRAGKTLAEVAVPESYRYIHDFLTLLESTFQIQGPENVVKIKTAREFADQLHVHPNYLNSLVKNQTGKTLREHIQERLLYEAKALLTHTDWEIRSISHVLGFSEQAAFTSFFSKKVNSTPSVFRETAFAPANS
jgi:AraC family transcriptional regulator, transcriptional activator of pobA